MLQYTKILEKSLFEENQDLHHCKELDKINELRQADGERRIYIFRDYENTEFNLGIGLEFTPVRFCPFCGSNIWGG